MKYADLEQNKTIKRWFKLSRIKPKTQRNYLFGMQYFTEFTGMSPEQLVKEARDEIENQIFTNDLSIIDHIIDFENELIDSKSNIRKESYINLDKNDAELSRGNFRIDNITKTGIWIFGSGMNEPKFLKYNIKTKEPPKYWK